MGCLTLFALPFLGLGLLSLERAVHELAHGRDPQRVALAFAVGVAFTTAGGGLLVLARFGRKREKQLTQLKAEHPREPWFWDPGWAERRIRSTERATTAGAWALAILWNSVSSPILFLLPDELRKGNKPAVIGLVFPLVGAGMIVWAIRATLRWRRFGNSVFELETLPAPAGGELRGSIITRLDPPPESVRLTLTCVRRYNRTNDDSATENVLWQNEQRVHGDDLRRETMGAVIPVNFAIPPDAPSSEPDATGSSVHWRLQAEALVPGVDYQSRFEVPVFRGVPRNGGTTHAQAVGGRAVTSAHRMVGDDDASAFDPADASVRVGVGESGGTEFCFGPARNVGAASSFTVMTAIFLAAAFGLPLLGVPKLFAYPSGFFGFLFLYVSLSAWFGSTTVEVTRAGITIRRRLLGTTRTEQIVADDVKDIGLVIGMQQQQTVAQSARAWYDIVLLRTNGRRVRAGTGVSNRQEADWLVSQMQGALKAAGAGARAGIDAA